jgi:uncharacterized protein
MTHPDGGFYSAEDADSEGHEGKFYCWTYDELSKLLPPDEFAVAAKYFGITKKGNFVDHSHPHPLGGPECLERCRAIGAPVSGAARRRGAHPIDQNEPQRAGLEAGAPADATLLAAARAKMLAERARRVRPHRDDKILASWNGLMLGAFARASAVLRDDKYLLAAEKNLAFIQGTSLGRKIQDVVPSLARRRP